MAGDENAPGAAPVGPTLRYTVVMTNEDGHQYGRHVLGRGVEEAIGHAMTGAVVERREEGGDDDDKPLDWADLDEEVEGVYYNHRGEVPAYDWRAIALRCEEICDEAVARARRALDEFIITGIPTTIPFHQFVVEEEHFARVEVYTDYVEKHVDPDDLAAFAMGARASEEVRDV